MRKSSIHPSAVQYEKVTYCPAPSTRDGLRERMDGAIASIPQKLARGEQSDSWARRLPHALCFYYFEKMERLGSAHTKLRTAEGVSPGYASVYGAPTRT